MKEIKPIFFALIAIVLLNSSVFADAQANFAKLPYDVLLNMHEAVSKKLTEKFPYQLRLFSSNPAVQSNDITLKLISDTETIPISMDKCGYFDLPKKRDLVGKGTFIVTNQPKGTMVLRGELRSQIPLEDRSIRYNDLTSCILAAQSAKNIAKGLPEIVSASYLNSLVLYVDQDGTEPVYLRLSEERPIKLIPDTDGNVSIPFEDKLVEKNPFVEFPSKNVFFAIPWE